MKKLIALLLAVVMVFGLVACGEKTPETTAPNETQGTTPPETTAPQAEATYTWKDSVVTLATNWNPHTYQTTDDSYPADFLRVGLYGFYFNDELHPKDGVDPYGGYVIIPEMAAALPVDVTEQVKAEHPEYGIPESATEGFAYVIDLNPNAVWEDGTPINADTYVESMKRLLDVRFLNYRASDYFAGNFCVAGAEAYYNSGKTVYVDDATVDFSALTLGEDGVYCTADGYPVYVAVSAPIAYFDGANSLADYVGAYGEEYFSMTHWEALAAAANEEGYAPLTEETKAYLTDVITGNPNWNEDESYLPNYVTYYKEFPVVEYDGTVGLYKTGDYQITLVLGKSLAGFNLLYNLSGNWIVNIDLYDACLTEEQGVWSSTYNTSVETTLSYGPYKMVSYQTDKAMRFERNENWYGYTDGQHKYIDPTDGETYDMYMTTAIDTQVVGEAATRKMMFLKGELMSYGLQADDFATYRQSEYCYATPSETIFFLILNGHMESIKNREASADFDQTTTDLEVMTLKSFHQAMGLTYDKDLFAATISPARSGGFGIIGTNYIYDPETGAKYRDTDQAKQVLCDFYAVDVSAFASLDDAVASITGYDPEQAKIFYQQAFDEAIAAGFITDNDGDGISDQTVKIEYCISSDSDFMTKTVDYLNEKATEVTAGTPFEGKILFTKSAPYGNEWSNKIKAGLADTVLGGWSGSALDPFGLTDLYTNPSYQYDAAWYDATQVMLTINVPVNGVDTDVTMNLKQWSDALNGATVEVDGVEYNYGSGAADVETRLDILAACEGKILESYNYLPMLQDGGMSLLSQQVFYVIDEYNPIMGRGGITYAKYNYTDAEWAAYVAEQGGELQY
ncbi:MAG: hypothetical protein IJ960_08220 [Oscillospiraceae bacterium]|nr:hypothetical protein [Oscillospiraceae bacterium]